MKKYILICMSFDGKFVTDSKHDTIEDAENASANIGSKWYFYPFHFIVKGKTVKETGEGLVNMATKQPYMPLMFKGKRITTVVKVFEKANKYCLKNDIQTDCYEFEDILINQTLIS